MRPVSNSIRRARPLLGTFVEITALGTSGRTDVAIDAAFAVVGEIHRLMSFHEPGSDVSRLNDQAAIRATPVHPWTYRVIEIAIEMYHRSDGAFDITIAPALQALGLLPISPYDDRAGRIVSGSKFIELLPGHHIQFHHPAIKLDLGGIAKGFAVDLALSVLRDHGMVHGLVNASGDMAAFGQGEAETVHIRDPRRPQTILCRTEVKDEALATTGARFDPAQSSEPFGLAIIAPGSQQPVSSVIGATVRAPSCVVADALTKIVMIRGEASAALLNHYAASALFVSAEGCLHAAGHWEGASFHAS